MGLSTSKKLLITAFLLIFGLFVFLWYKDFFFPADDSGKKSEGTALEKPEEEVAADIKTVQKQLEELSKLSPEEKKKREEERQVLTAQDVTADIPVPGVEIITEGQRKIIKNITEGYRIEIPGELIIARAVTPDLIEIHDPKTMCKEDPSCDPIMRIRVTGDNPQKLDLEKWFLLEEEKYGSPVYSPREKIIINGSTAYRIIENIPAVFDGYYYYWSRGAKVYYLRISAFDEEKYREFIETFRFE